MTSSIKKIKDSQVELTVDLDKHDLLGYITETEKRLAASVRIEGFRPGKVPKEVLRNKIGEQAIKEEALSLAVQSSLAKAISAEKLEVIEQSDFKIKENLGDKLVYQVNLVVFPEIKLGDYKGLTIKKNPVVIADLEIKNVLEDLINSRTVLKSVDMPAKIGDRVEVDFVVKDKGVIIEGGKSENHPVILGDNKFMPGFEENIIGMKPGDTKSFSIKAPADYYQKTIAGKDLDFEVTVRLVEERIPPKLDDDFAKSLGGFQSMKEIEENIKKGLSLEKENKEKERVRLAIIKEVSEKTKLEVPSTLVERRIDAMIRNLDEELHQKNMELGPYLAHIKKTQDELRKDWRPRAEEQVKFGLVAKAIANAEDLKVTDKEVQTELETVLQQFMVNNSGEAGISGPEALKNINPEELKTRISDVLLNEKVFEFLEKQTKFV